MNLNDFSLLKEDEKHYVVGHPKGKSIQVGKQGLSDKAHQLISKLKKHQDYAEGTEEAETPVEEISPVETAPAAAPQDDFDYMKNRIGGFAQQIGNRIFPNAQAQLEAERASLPKTMEEAQAMTPAPEGVSQLTPEEQKAESLAAEQKASAALKAEQAEPAAPKLPGAPNVSSLEKEEASINEALKTEKLAGQQVKKAYGEAAKAYQAAMPSPQLYEDFKAKDQALAEAIAKKEINPDRYLNNMSTGSKISSAIGLILSGMGAAVTGGPNLALQQLNKSIDSDIEAQRNDQSKAMNLWKMNREAYQSDTAASLATQNQMLTLAEVKAKEAIAAVPGSQAALRMAPLLADIQSKKDLNAWTLSKLKGSPAGTEQAHLNEMQVMQQVNPTAYKELQARYVPGIGVAKIPLRPQTVDELSAITSLNKKVKAAMDFQIGARTGLLGTFKGSEAHAIAQSMREGILVEMNKLYKLNRITEIEYENFKHQVPEIGTFQNAATMAKLEQLSKQIEEQQQTTLNSYGVMPFATNTRDEQAAAWARANPNNPLSKQIMATQLGNVR